MSQYEDISYSKPQKQKGLNRKALSVQSQGKAAKEIQMMKEPMPLKTGQKDSKRNLKNNKPSSVVFHKPEISNSDSMPESGNEYRALRRKYLLLEEESFALGASLREVEDNVNTLEEKKLALLDELVVLEGLVDRSELQPQGGSHLSEL